MKIEITEEMIKAVLASIPLHGKDHVEGWPLYTALGRGNIINERSKDEYARAAISEVAPLIAKQAHNRAVEACAEAAGTYCWNRYKSEHLTSPAVFTSHTWQDIAAALRSLKEE